MDSVINYTNCPVCGATAIREVLTAKDHTVSGKSFSIWECASCTFRFTQHVPDEAHIGPYYKADSYISHTNTSKGLVNRLYKMVRNITLRNKRKLLQAATNRTTGQLLEIGAGTGIFAAFMKKSGWQVMGLEPDPDVRQTAKDKNGVALLDTSELFELPTEHFDVITMWHVLEHVHRLHEYMAQLKKLLKPGGVLLIAVPNYTSFDAQLYGRFWAAYDVPRHLYHFSPASMRNLLKSHDLRLEKIQPMWFDSFYVSMLSEKYKNGKASLVKGFINGLRSNLKAGKGNYSRCSSLIYVIRP
jgi:2-polyprenyl-3-methyl-5-hydroxy-6-metoxy-1,4-benzoquinol methylase